MCTIVSKPCVLSTLHLYTVKRLVCSSKKCGGPNLANTHEPSIAIIPRLANLHVIPAIEGIIPTATGGNYDSVQCCRQVDFSALMVFCLLRSTE